MHFFLESLDESREVIVVAEFDSITPQFIHLKAIDAEDMEHILTVRRSSIQHIANGA